MNVSLCLIARNEEDCLARCLESARDLVREIIVVDTGSTDRTAEIAAQSGARVFSYAWENDFAAARNHALGQAAGDWILVLDADEVLGEVEPDRWVGLLAAADVEGYFLEIRSYLGEGRKSSDQVVRLFRNKPGYAFRGAIHEQVAGAIKAESGRLRFSGLVIHHFGYLDMRIKAKNKHRRNMAVITRALAARPRDPFLLYSLGIEYFQDNDPERGITFLTQALALMHGGEGYFRDCLVTLGMGLLGTGQAGALRSYLENCLRMLPLDPGLHLLQGLLALAEGRYGQAAAGLRLAREIPAVGRGLALRLLGDACHLAGRGEEAGQAYLAALAEDPLHLYPLTQILAMKQRGHAGPGWEELSRFTSPAGQISLAKQLVRLGETALALVCALLAVIQAPGVLPCSELQRLLSLPEPALERPKTVWAYLRACAAEMLLLAEAGSPVLPDLSQLTDGCLELVAGQLCPLLSPPVYRQLKELRPDEKCADWQPGTAEGVHFTRVPLVPDPPGMRGPEG